MADEAGEEQPDQLSEPEQLFIERWKGLIDRFGTQAQASRRLRWSTSALSRDYTGATLPPDERVKALATELKLPKEEHEALADSLTAARAARAARRKTATDATPPEGRSPEIAGEQGSKSGTRSDPAHPRDSEAFDPSTASRWPRWRSRRMLWGAGGAAAVVVVGAIAAFHGTSQNPGTQPRCPAPSSRSGSPTAASDTTPTAQPTKGGGTGLGVRIVDIPVASLSPTLLRSGGWDQAPTCTTIPGFQFVNSATNLCLSIDDTQPTAGRNGERVRLWPCDSGPDQIWIPVQWDATRSDSTWLASDKYQSKCLNADERRGLTEGHGVQLWDCYDSPTGNESWDFAGWLTSVGTQDRPSPLYLGSHAFCLDADKGNLGKGDQLVIWPEYGGGNQLWS